MFCLPWYYLNVIHMYNLLLLFICGLYTDISLLVNYNLIVSVLLFNPYPANVENRVSS